MKKIYAIFILCLIHLENQAQTTLKYSGTATQNITGYVGLSKLSTISEINITNPAEVVSNHFGVYSSATNGSLYNIGVFGTTKKNTIGSASYYVGVLGDNYTNTLSASNTTAYGGYFISRNGGANSTSYGLQAFGAGSNNTSYVVGVDAIANNTFNTTPNQTVAVRGVTTSGQSTVVNIFKDVANPAGYFSSSDGQGVYATTSGTYKFGSTTVSQAITGYSNVINAFDNIGVLGFAEGTGSFKAGLYGVVDGTAGTIVSSGIVGQDNIGVANSYAGYFNGKVWVDGKIGIGTNTVTATEQMEVNGRIRIRRNAFTSGLWFNNSVNGTGIADGAFVGLSNETAGSESVGFWLAGNFKFLVDRSGNTTVGGGLSVGGGQTINKIIKTSISVNINAYAAASFFTQTFTISGVSTGDNIVVNMDGLSNLIVASTRVSANDTIEIKFYNPGGANGFPTPVTMYVTAFK